MARPCNECNKFNVLCKCPEACHSVFTITMVEGCGNFAVVPQFFKDRLNDFAENFFVVVDCHGFEYDFHIQIGTDATLLCGAYWKLFAKTHKLKPGASVHFSAVEDGDAFSAVLVGQPNDVVLHATLFGLREVSADVRNLFHSTVFKNMADLTDREVRRVLKILDGLDAPEFFEREIIVQKMTDLDLASRVLVIPCKSKNVPRIPTSWYGNFSSERLSNKFMALAYSTTNACDTVIHQGWEDLCICHGIRSGSVLMFEVGNAAKLFVQVYIVNL
ncbi:uncharacterized protein LOC112269361 [Brachypodium distachyon]|uniref:uncharacterized protein LOC112269361 n=1 Tax=Brachypodium distachyon TaxID=15368 RepID=UPI000D0CA407|nr:uncharacterized protein LOC112269361 [Brachypodium distachyon]|eukprot:XP_024311801.1 uncharacterized protein LOC112269361 [Brachypodium distachyon]